MKELKLQNFAGDGVGKLKRSHLIHYIDASFGDGEPKWFLIGKDVEDMSVELNPDTETKKNILDETSTQDNGYKMSRPNVQKILYKNVQLVCLS